MTDTYVPAWPIRVGGTYASTESPELKRTVTNIEETGEQAGPRIYWRWHDEKETDPYSVSAAAFRERHVPEPQQDPALLALREVLDAMPDPMHQEWTKALFEAVRKARALLAQYEVTA